MNFGIIKRNIGWLLIFLSIFFTVPMITAAIYWEAEFFAFLISAAIALSAGLLCVFAGRVKSEEMYAKEGFVTVALSWIVMSLFGALPFVISGAIPSFVDALFEIVSGFTTTGATILSAEGINTFAKSMLMWRSFSHWIGGMGVLVFMMAFLPMSGARNLHMMQAESTGASVSKLVPKMKQTAKILYIIYFAMTFVQFVLLLIGKMPLFDAVNTAFATAGTGGFATSGDSMAGYSPYLQIVVTVFMILFSINFNSFYLIVKGKFCEAFTTEVKTFLVIVLAAISIISVNVYFCADNWSYTLPETVLHSAFSVASIISTTGFATVDFNLWPTLSKTILVLVMFIGACAGSTGGGIKVSRLVVGFKGAKHEVGQMIHPNRVKRITVDGRPIEQDVVRSIFVYFIAFAAIFAASVLLISLDGKTAETTFTAVAATINNIGPGLGEVGPAGNFADFSVFSKFVFIFDMLLGRLELFPMLVLFAPSTWRK